ncbi:MAG: nucleotidyltransferase domain-containing protein [Chlorobi bacterium]|nr:nucleotidyltransferase domain-containing protein [Chlorobiota bacterium]
MDNSKVIDIAKQFATLVSEKYDCVNIILFGSYAKGVSHSNSDIDIAVILKDYDNLFDIQVELMKLRRKIDTRIEPHPIKESEFNDNSPLFLEIKKYGKIINVA